MKLNTERARQAGREVLTAAEELKSDQTPDSLRSASQRLRGLELSDALSDAATGYEDFLRRFGNELEWLGNTVVSAADVVDMTEEAAKASFDQVDIPV
ncbi:hypothetical protein [Segniliparus rugosus]|uniref:Excreted virulence factor EspC, type VII ESX diderm n=1 Tax=Segniliparus rugosus (strain ATCC BAA-974 / DSM 45345 / CCUG 50838 / CIP 108380 / JCM 13579 / CDC 945) TaxID=679197 RepID=E5XR53_SEGRC|nr:hypothetical protein [Segniliparus rugosus]EFV13146.1 hypothetical protein HMPREF9336_01975 [Segniliparus rugosus ATCC BAA-974]